jgi:hypothetical protein
MKEISKSKSHELESILLKLNMDQRVSVEVFDYINNKLKFVETIALVAYDGEMPNFMICKRRPFTRLVIICFKLMELNRRYQEKGIPDSIFFDTIQDVKLRQELYYKATSKLGLSKDDVIWFRHIFNMHLFKLNALQFQLFHMLYLDKETIGEEYMAFSQEQKDKLPSGSPVINVHVQRYADLSPAAVEKSFDMAKKFFEKYYAEHNFSAFLCYSWLLYSGNKQLLDNDSNIIKFAKRFEIVSEVHDINQAIFDIYGKRFRKKTDYPNYTSLQRKALIHPEYLGYSCGLFYVGLY